MATDKPFLSTRDLIENYSFLVEYMKKCKDRGLDCTKLLPTSQLLDELYKKIDKEAMSFEQVINYVNKKLGNEVNCDLCIDVFREIYKTVVGCEEAKKMLITQLAGWYIEILESLGYVKIRPSWKH